MAEAAVPTISSITALLIMLPAAALMGIVPRVGPGRALALAVQSWVRRADIVSRREDATHTLREMLRSIGKGQYIAVTGPKGIGKSVVVNTATQGTCGVVSVSIEPATLQSVIVEKALSKVINVSYSHEGFIDPHPSAMRVLWWYSWFLPPPIVVLHAGERYEGNAFAQIPSAARELADYGLRVIVDCSPNSLPLETMSTLRTVVLELAPMSRSVLQSIPEYADLFAMLRTEGLEDVAWLVLGGVPAHFDMLLCKLRRSTAPADQRRVVIDYLLDEVRKAILFRNKMLCSHPAMEAILSEFKSMTEVPRSLLAKKCIVIPSPNNVVRIERRNHVSKLVPADAAMALVLCNDYEATPSIEELMKLASACPVAATPGPP